MKTFQTHITATYSKVVHVEVRADSYEEVYGILDEALYGIPAEDMDHPAITVIGVTGLEWDEDTVDTPVEKILGQAS